MVRVRYDGTVTYAFLVVVRYGTLVRCLNLPTTRFMGNVRIGVARIFDWGGPNHKSYAMTSSEILKKRTFLWAEDIVEWKI